MSRRPNNARISRRKVEEGVWEQPQSDLRDDEQDRGDEGQQDHSQGAADGKEAREEVEQIPVQNVQVGGPYSQEKTRPLGSMDYHRQDDIFKRMGSGAPPSALQFDEHWRGKVGGSTYRLVVWRAYSFIPERISLERLISQGSEPETWTAEVVPQ